MPDRPLLSPDDLSADVRAEIAVAHLDTIREVDAARKAHDVVVVGMAQNPNVWRARRLLKAAGIPHHYIGYGSYLSEWQRRLAIKMWTGWPTFPQVFVKGVLLGGSGGVATGLKDGSLAKALGR